MGTIDRIHTKRLLVVDDAPEIRALVRAVLEDEGYTNLAFAAGHAEALAEFQRFAPEFALLDVMLPDGDGFSLARQLRAMDPRLPVMFLTAKDRPEDRLSGLTLGADDYLVKPFLPQELTLRIGAILRRCYPQDAASAELALAACTVDMDNAEVHRADGTTAQLTAKELSLLEALARNAGRIVTIDALCEELWGPACFGYENSLMTHVRRLREKIEADPSHPESLVTAKGLGYRLNVRKRA